MLSASIAPWQLCFSLPNRTLSLRLSHHRKISLYCRTHLENEILSTEPSNKINGSYPDKKRAILEQLYFSFDDPDPINHTHVKRIEEKRGEFEEESQGLSSNMWWAEVKAAVGQRINVEGIVSSVSVITKDRHLALPHLAVRDIRYIDWGELKRTGFRGVVFDKDNTITAPYSLTLWPPLETSIGQCKSVFGNNIAVCSNSAGLFEFDPDGRKARALESAIGIKVARHRVKKPAGTAEEIEKHFGCESSQLIMVGDRPFTDIVYGNRNGFFTILTGPLSLAEEPFIVKQVRKLEIAFVNLCYKRGLKPMSHRLLTDAVQCLRDPRSL